MQSAKQKAADAAAVAKEHVDILRAKAQEKAEVAAATTKEGRQIAHERRKVKEAEAKMHMHEAKADHAAEKLQAEQHGFCGLCRTHHHPHHQHAGGYQEPVLGYAVPPHGVAAPTYPLGGHPLISSLINLFRFHFILVV